MTALLLAALLSAEPPTLAGRVKGSTPQEALAAFQVAPGYQVELVAAEPLVQSPVAIAFDEKGRVFVAEMPDYNGHPEGKPLGLGRIVRLDDTNGDGQFDRRTVFAAGLNYPTGLAVWKEGLYVGAAPDLLWMPDANDDGVADGKEVVLTGFGTDKANEGQLNSFLWTLECRLRISTGLDGGKIGKPGDTNTVDVRSLDLLFDPRTRTFDTTTGGGQYGATQDDFGRTYFCQNSRPCIQALYDVRDVRHNPHAVLPPATADIQDKSDFAALHRISPNEAWRGLRTNLRKSGAVPGSAEGGKPGGFFTGASGLCVYRGDALPELRGQLFVGEVSNNMVVRMKLEPDGARMKAVRIDRGREFLASTDTWFRPAQIANAPDGCLYIVDVSRELIETIVSLPPEVLKTVDPRSGLDRGRLWRIVSEKEHADPPATKLHMPAPFGITGPFESQNGWNRDTAARLNHQRRGQPHEKFHPFFFIGATQYTLTQFATCAQALGIDHSVTNRALLDDTDLGARAVGLRLLRARTDEAWRREYAERLDPEVNGYLACERARALAAFGRLDLLLKLAKNYANDADVRAAILVAVGKRRGEALRALLKEQPPQELLVDLAAQCMRAGGDDAKAVAALIDAPNGPALFRQAWERAGRPASGRTEPAFQALRGKLLAEATADLLAPGASAAARVAALKTLSLGDPQETLALLAGLLKPEQPAALQAAALAELGRLADPAAAQALLAAWPSLTPTLRASAAESLLARPAWHALLLDAAEKGTVKPADLSPTQQQALRASVTLGARAKKLFPETAAGARQALYQRYLKELPAKGDAVRGKELFAKHCGACHKLHGVGENIGADLAGVRNRGRDFALLAILDPNREVLPAFVTYLMQLKDGRTVTGMILSETPAGIVLRKADKTTETMPRSEIESMKSSGVSLMPEGLEKDLPPAALADVLEFLLAP